MKTDTNKKVLTILGFLLGSYILAVILQSILFANRFGASTEIAGVDLGYMSTATAKSKLEEAFKTYAASEVIVGGQAVKAGDYITEADIKKSVENALLREQRGYFNFSKIMGQDHSLVLVYNDEAITKKLLKAYDDFSVIPVDASIVSGSKMSIKPEVNGRRLLLVESKELLRDSLAEMKSAIDLRVVPQPPVLTAAEAERVIDQAEANISEPIIIYGDGTRHEISQTELRSWLKIYTTNPKSLVVMETFLPRETSYYYLNQNKVFLYVDKLAGGIDKSAINAKLTTVNGKVVVDTKEVIGQVVDKVDAITQIQQAVIGNRTVNLKITSVKPEIRADNLSELGLTELVSTGWSDFTGSPVNRTHNVKTGASKFDGLVIKPDENFSFNKALGPVDASTGYLPELVILADKTVPEFGGGLCQVSSTAFRAALNAGLPILERHAHAYPVSYYKPFGVDATIYLPSPDLRFQNDTGKYVLIQTRIEGKKLYFDFYGTKKPVKITFSGNDKADGAVEVVEKVSPTISDQGARGSGSFTSVFYRHIYDAAGKLTDNDKFTSRYDSPDKYPH